MSRINDFDTIRVATPLIDVEHNNNAALKVAKPQVGKLFEPAGQPLVALNNPTALQNFGGLSVVKTLPGPKFTPPSTGPTGPIGTSTAALTAGETSLPDIGNMPFLIQDGNSCGTTTLAKIMSYLGVPMTQDDIDAVIRRLNTFTAPDDMIEFARDHGLEAEGYNNGTWEEVKSMIDAGFPVQAMVNGDDSVAVNGGSESFSVDGLHYIAITGYGTDPATGEEYVIYQDPNRGTEQRMSVADFEKMWSDVPGGFENYFVAYGPKGADLPPGRDDGIESTLGVLNGVTNITNGLDRIFSPDSFGDFIHGIPQFAGGLVQTVGSFVGGLAQLGAGWLNNAVEGIPVLENFVQPIGDLVNGVGAVIGDVFNGIGEAVDSLGGAFGSLFEGDLGGFVEGVGDAVGDVVGGVADAVGDAVGAVGDAISDIFSGW
jgi:predicted double-glycine peptidase